MPNQRAIFQTSARLTLNAASGGYRVVAMAAGTGNAWIFTDEAIKASLALWNGLITLLDHSRSIGHPSVRDMCARTSDATWNADDHQLQVTLTPCAPAGDLLKAICDDVLANPTPHVGMSADVEFTASGQSVDALLVVHSLDLVINPALDGRILRATNQRAEGVTPMETSPALCSALLDAELRASNLPDPAKVDLRARFAGTFEPAALTAAMATATALVAALALPPQIVHPTSSLFSSEDQLQAAVDDLLGAPRAAGAAGHQVHRLSGIRELYHTMTGDYELHGGYHADRARFATTADFTGLVKNALNKVVSNQWDVLGKAGYDWWTKICTVEGFSSLNGITGTLCGTVGTLPTVAEGAEYTELAVGDSPETATFTKYGGYIPLTLELIDRDETRKLKAYPRELANAGLRMISSLVAAVFSSNAGAGPTMADTGALFNANAITTLGGHVNYLTTALAAASLELAKAAVYNQPMLVKQAAGYYGTGPKQAVDPRYLLVPRALTLTAMQLVYPINAYATQINSQNMQRGEPGDVITVPEWTDATDWAVACDPAVAPAIFVGHRFGIQPEIFIAGDELSPAVFSNDEHRLKVRHFLAVWVNDFRPLLNNHV